jgi:hypothetical protein
MAILWSLVQHKQGTHSFTSQSLDSWIDTTEQSDEVVLEQAVWSGDVHEYLRGKAHLLSPTCLLLLETWMSSLADSDQDTSLPLSLSAQESDTEAKIEIPDKV